MKKKIWMIFLCSLLLICLTSCGRGKELPEDFNTTDTAMMVEDITLSALKLSDTDLEVAAHEAMEPLNDLCEGILTANEAVGNPQRILGTTFTQNEDMIIATVEVQHEERTVDYEYTFSPNPEAEYNPAAEKYILIQIVVSPRYPMGELMEEAGMNTLMGMGVVFLVLIFISFVISLFRFLPGSGAKKQPVKKEEPKKEAVSTPAPSPVSAPLMEDQELVAVITAAILAAGGDDSSVVSSDQLIVRSIKRVSR